MARSVEEIAISKRKEMDAMEADYLRAKQYVQSEDWTTDQLRALAKIRSIVRQGIMEQGESLMMIGRIQQILLDTYRFESIIARYDGLKQSLDEMYPDKQNNRK